MVMVTGPTGSGKTNTLYSAISRLNQPDTNIMTAEDPVEFQLGGVNQVQMKEQIGLNFAAALRSFLRQDPNIILVSEIRDFETAEIAIKAALTGHLVLSTLHTNGAPETITRLMNMGIEPFLVATSVHLICAQRLVRRICKDCIEVMDVPAQTLLDAGFTPEESKSVKIQKGKGCGVCNNTGYKGRCGLYEVMEVDDEIRELVLVGASAVELKKKAIERGMITLRRSGLIKVMAGMTTLEEVARETIHCFGIRNRKGRNFYGFVVKRSAEENAGDERQRPAHHHQLAAPDSCARPSGAARSAANDAGRDQAVGIQCHDRFPEAPLRRKPRTGLLVWIEGTGPLPRERFQPGRRHRRRVSFDSFRNQIVQSAGSGAS